MNDIFLYCQHGEKMSFLHKKTPAKARGFFIALSIITCYLRPRAIFARATSPSLSMKYSQPDSR